MNLTIEKMIMEELKAIRRDLDFIKEHMIDRDTILTSEEEEILEEAMKEFREGKAIKLEKLESERTIIRAVPIRMYDCTD